jgi:putative heme-binding domain-containing protein
MRFLAASLTLLLSCGVAFGQQPLPKVPESFKIELVAKAPDIEAPTALAVAANGDVYFAEDPMDMRGPSNKNADKIWLVKGGDFTKRFLIADKMWAVMGLEVVGDKLYVVHYPYISVFTLDAFGKATKREDLFTDVGPKSAPPGGFNDHVPSGIRMGMDGWLYVSIGDKGIPKMTRNPSDPITDGIEVAEGRMRRTKDGRFIKLEGGGVIRFRPDGSRLEVFASGTRNHLDVPLDDQDRIFVRDNTDDGDGWNTRFMFVAKNGYYGYPWAFTRHPQEVLPMIHDFGPGAPCQGWVYSDDGLPEKYRGRIFHCEWGRGKIFAVKVLPQGAGFKYGDEIAFVDPAGTSVKDFRPYSIRPTADGLGFYITDWNFGGWQQPKVVGRIYKVTYVKNDVKSVPRGNDGDGIEQLLKCLDHPAHSERLRAQRALIARAKDVVPALTAALDKKALGVAARRHAAWIFTEIGGDGSLKAVLDLTRDPDSTVRAQATRALGSGWLSMPVGPGNKATADAGLISQIKTAVLQLLEADADPEIRMIAAQVLPIDSSKLPWEALGKQKDHFVRFALARQMQRTADWNEVTSHSKEELLKKDAASLEVILLAVTNQYDLGALGLLKVLLEHPDALVRKTAIEAIARVHHDRKPYPGTWWGTRPEQQKPPVRAIAWEGTPVVRTALLEALGDKDAGVRKSAVVGILALNDPDTVGQLQQQFAKETGLEARVDIVHAIGGLKSPKAVDWLAELALRAEVSEAVRLEAVFGLEQIHDPSALEALAKILRQAPGSALETRAVEALGSFKGSASARAFAEAALQSTTATTRQRALGALARIGDAGAAKAVMPMLDDANEAVRLAAVHVLSELKATVAVPALIKAAGRSELQFDATVALARIPDIRALSVYLTGLQSKNAILRQDCRQAISAIRDQAAPVLEQLSQRKEIPTDVLPELRTVYAAYAPMVSWKLIGPFPDDDKSYPPEKEQNFKATYKGIAGDVRWTNRKGDAKTGKVNLLPLYTPNTDVAAYGYAEYQSDANREALLVVGSDDSIVIWLNGTKVHEFAGTRSWSADSDKVKVTLKKGKNTLLIKCGQKTGDWVFSITVSGDPSAYAFLKDVPKTLDLAAFRAFARKTDGNAERGQRLFLDLKGLACAKCHAILGQGGKVGPDLAGIALRYNKEDIITSILEPSKVIAQGYETHVITTNNGTVITGVFKGDDGDNVTIMDADGKEHKIAKKDIDERRVSPLSTMPNGLADGMTLQDFADVVAFLLARKEEQKAPR